MEYQSLFVLLLLAIAAIGDVYSTRQFIPSSCSHSPDLDMMEHVHITPKKGYHRSKRDASSFNEMFTMEVHYDESVNTGLNSSTLAQIQNTVLPELKKFYESSLSVRELPGPLVFDRSCTNGSILIFSNEEERYCRSTCTNNTCGGILNVPMEYLKRCRECNNIQDKDQCTTSGSDGAGSNTSFVLLVSAITTGPCPTPGNAVAGSTLAFAGSCEMEDEFDRPVLGYVNFCPVSINQGQSDDYLLTVTKHEILHALGFSNGLFKWFRDENGDPRTPRDDNNQPPEEASNNTLRRVTYTDWDTVNGPVSHTVSLLVTPKIVEEGRRHFNCSTLEGVQLEDQGGPGTAGSHWEARITKGEFMNGVIDNDAVFSRLTFALLEDSGWYKANYSYADQLVWARGAGCELAAGSCGGYIESQQAKSESIAPFCDYAQDPPTQYGCNIQRTGVSNCNLITFQTDRPTQYQYFSSALEGGSFQTADYCPFQTAFSNTICADTANTKTGLSNSLAETHGPGSRCVVHGSSWRAQEGNSLIEQNFPRAGCYNYTCSNGQVIIHILDQSYTCTTRGQQLAVSQTSDGVTYTGSIICPSCLEICYDDFVNCPEAALVYSEFAALADIGSGDFDDVITDPPTDRPKPTTPTTTTTSTDDDGGRGSGAATIRTLSFMIYVLIFVISFYLLY